MQTTSHNGISNAPSISADRAPDDEAVIDISVIVQTLMHAALELRYRADALEQQAHELDDGDDDAHMHASKLREKRSADLALADEMNHAAAQMKFDPHKKIPRQKLEALQHQVSGAIQEGESETHSAVAVHASSSEHKEARHINNSHSVAKPSPHAPVHSKKSGTKSKKHGDHSCAAYSKTPVKNTHEWHAPGLLGSYSYAAIVHSTVNMWEPFGAMNHETMRAPVSALSSPLVRTLWSVTLPPQAIAAAHAVHIPQNLGPLVHHPVTDFWTPPLFGAAWGAGLPGKVIS